METRGTSATIAPTKETENTKRKKDISEKEYKQNTDNNTKRINTFIEKRKRMKNDKARNEQHINVMQQYIWSHKEYNDKFTIYYNIKHIYIKYFVLF